MKTYSRGMAVVLFLCSLCKSAPAASAPETSSAPNFDAKSFPKLAVIVVGGGNERSSPLPEGAQTSGARLVEDEFLGVLMKNGYSIAARSDLRTVLKELAFQNSGLTEKDAASVGKMLNVPAVFVVSITELTAQVEKPTNTKGKPQPKQYTLSVAMSARLVGVEGATILWMGKYRQSQLHSKTPNASELVSRVAKSIALAFPSREPSQERPKLVNSQNDLDATPQRKTFVVEWTGGKKGKVHNRSEIEATSEEDAKKIVMQKDKFAKSITAKQK